MYSFSMTLEEKGQRALEWDRLLAHLAARAATSLGRERCLTLPLAAEVSQAREALQETSEARALLDRDLVLPTAGLQDVRAAIARASKGAVLEPREFLAIRESLGTIRALRAFFRTHGTEAPALAGRAALLPDLGALERPLARAFDADGHVTDEASPELGELRRAVVRLQNRLHRDLTQMLHHGPYAELLQEPYYTQRADRYVLPLRAEVRGQVRGIVHDTSASGATLYFEPEELVGLNNDLKLARLGVEQEILRILTELSARIAAEGGALTGAVEVATALDVALARGRLSQALQAHEPRLNETGAIRLFDARHPLLALEPGLVVPNDLVLADGLRGLIITGPNTGGKTVCLKTLGLCALMVRAGLHLPAAAGSEMALFPRVFAEIGDEQSLEAHLSSFSAQMVDLIGILGAAGPMTLVLLDEIVAATDPTEGAALAKALLLRLVEKGATVVATTHYRELTTLALEEKAIGNAGMEFDQKGLRPTYRLASGLPGLSYGVEVAARLGLDPQVVARARSFLGPSALALNTVIADLERRRAALQQTAAEVRRLRDEARTLHHEAEERLRRLRAREKELIDEVRATFQPRLAETRTLVARLLRQAREAHITAAEPTPGARAPLQEAAVRLQALDLAVRRVSAEVAPALEGKPVDWTQVQPGAELLVTPLGRRGRLVAGPNPQGKVTVQLGAVRMAVDAADVREPEARRPAHGGSEPGAQAQGRPRRRAPGEARRQEGRASPQRGTSGVARPAREPSRGDSPRGDPETGRDRAEPASEARAPQLVLPTAEDTCDLRGQTVDEALSTLTAFQDHALLARRLYVCVIHGHGTGALKSAVRGYLTDSPYAAAFRPGQPGEGGDGVTIVEVRA
ncbi:MAG: endonuclease MutS2 [Deltaproteobacteria bacterium]|nr:endonuclease MutS2 [Deltaproteobacteria bacterium]